MKKKLFFILALSLVCLYNVSLFAKTKTARKRAATGGNSSSAARKRAATNASTKRAANTKRAGNLNAKRQARSVGGSGSGSAASATPSTVCPLGTPIKRLVDEEGTETFYSSKSVVCSKPENTNGVSDLGDLKQPSWIAGKDIWIFSCNPGYLQLKGTDGESCVDKDTLCPLNTTVKKSDGVYYNPYTNEVCTLPMYATTLKLTEETNTNPSISEDEAFYTYCINNYYKSDDVECSACPSGKFSSPAKIKRDDIIGEDGQLMGQKETLIEGASSINQCLTAEEM